MARVNYQGIIKNQAGDVVRQTPIVPTFRDFFEAFDHEARRLTGGTYHLKWTITRGAQSYECDIVITVAEN